MSRNGVAPGGRKMPLWEDLGRSLAADMREYEYTTAIEAISSFSQQFSRAKLVERLSDLLLLDSAKPGNVHKAFCSIKFPIVCTTNFDFLLEKQYDLNPRYCRPVADQADTAASADDSQRILRRPRTSFGESEHFLQQVSNWFAERAEIAGPALNEEPERLLNMGSPRAAVIAATTLLEIQLRKRMNLASEPNRPMALGQITRLAAARELLGEKDVGQIQEWLKVRNAAVHTPKPISMRDARSVVRGVRVLLMRLK